MAVGSSRSWKPRRGGSAVQGTSVIRGRSRGRMPYANRSAEWGWMVPAPSSESAHAAHSIFRLARLRGERPPCGKVRGPRCHAISSSAHLLITSRLPLVRRAIVQVLSTKRLTAVESRGAPGAMEPHRRGAGKQWTSPAGRFAVAADRDMLSIFHGE